MTEQKRQRISGVSRRVSEYLSKVPNTVVHVGDIASDTGLTRHQVLYSLANLRARNGYTIETRLRGESYIYRPSDTALAPSVIIPQQRTKSTPRIFEEVGSTRDGVTIVRDEEAQLYRLADI